MLNGMRAGELTRRQHSLCGSARILFPGRKQGWLPGGQHKRNRRMEVPRSKDTYSGHGMLHGSTNSKTPDYVCPILFFTGQEFPLLTGGGNLFLLLHPQSCLDLLLHLIMDGAGHAHVFHECPLPGIFKIHLHAIHHI